MCFFIKEISSLYRLGHVLVPILFGMVYYKEKKTDDNILYNELNKINMKDVESRMKDIFSWIINKKNIINSYKENRILTT